MTPGRSAIGALSLSLLSAVTLSACSSTAAPHRAALATRTRVVVTATRLPWQLPNPVSRLVALPDGNAALLAGGLSRSNASSNAVYRVNMATGGVHQVGTVPRPFHDAAGAQLGGRAFVYGGGAASSIAAVQEFTGGGAGRVTGQLPRPRSDLTSVTTGGRVVLLGGYTGTKELADVLVSADGASTRVLTRLPVTVRYAAATSLGSTVWVFGGQHGRSPTGTIQRIDATTGSAAVVAHLPVPLAGAAALTISGHIVLVGGRTADGAASGTIYLFDPVTNRLTVAAQLPVPVANAGAAVINGTGYVFGGENSTQVSTVQSVTVRTVTEPIPTPTAASSASGEQIPALSDTHPFNGRLLIADRGNNRLILVDVAKHVLWTFPNTHASAPASGFYFPDDAFFTRHGTGIISNQEKNHTIVEISFPAGRTLWSYGHRMKPGVRAGYLNEPDDAYRLTDGNVTVADAFNCRILVLSPAGQVLTQIGTPGVCSHKPPDELADPNGDTPLANGDLLVSETKGSWITEYTQAGSLVWSRHLAALKYPSDPQQIGADRYIVADYHRPGGVYEFNRAGQTLWSYHPATGPGMLDHPSLAEVLPGGFICVNDDYDHRVVIIDPRTKLVIWQYGHKGSPGRRLGYLNTPDGFDLLAPDGTTPTHPTTG